MKGDVRVDCKKPGGFPLGNQRLYGPYQGCGRSFLKAWLRELFLIGFDLLRWFVMLLRSSLYFFWFLIVHLN